MRRFRLKPAAWLIPIFLILCIVGAKHIDRMIDRFIDEILSPQGNSGVRNFLDGGDEASNLYGWHNNEEFAEGGYYYEHTDEDRQIAYQVLYQAITDRNGETPLGTEDREVIMDAYNYITYDHPEIFYTTGYDLTEYTFKNGTTHLTFSVKYSESKEDQEVMEQYIALYANSVLESVDSEWSDYDKIKYIYDRIINETSYDLNGAHAYNLYAVAHDHEGVCEGYAKMFKYLFNAKPSPEIQDDHDSDTGFNDEEEVFPTASQYIEQYANLAIKSKGRCGIDASLILQGICLGDIFGMLYEALFEYFLILVTENIVTNNLVQHDII